MSVERDDRPFSLYRRANYWVHGKLSYCKIVESFRPVRSVRLADWQGLKETTTKKHLWVKLSKSVKQRLKPSRRFGKKKSFTSRPIPANCGEKHEFTAGSSPCFGWKLWANLSLIKEIVRNRMAVGRVFCPFRPMIKGAVTTQIIRKFFFCNQPHFYNGDPSLLEKVESGLEPDKEKHEIRVDFEIVSRPHAFFSFIAFTQSFV